MPELSPYGPDEPMDFSFSRDAARRDLGTLWTPPDDDDQLQLDGDASHAAEDVETLRRQIHGDRHPDMPESIVWVPQRQLAELRPLLNRYGTGYRLEPDPNDAHDWIAVWPVQGWTLPIRIP